MAILMDVHDDVQVRALALGEGVRFRDAGTAALEGVARSVQIHEVDWRSAG